MFEMVKKLFHKHQKIQEPTSEVAQFQMEGLGSLVSVVLIFATVGMVSAFTLQILVNVQTTFTVNSSPYNATGTAITTIATVLTYLTILVSVVMGGLVIRILIGSFSSGFGGGARR
jgi:hypothetical protein